jgi:hypothetical protein
VAAGVYALAKLGEVLDSLVFAMGGIVSGHTLKHIIAAAAIYLILRMLKNRKSRAAVVTQRRLHRACA